MHILIVEDEPSIADSLRYALSTEGFSVALVGTLGLAWQSLRDLPPDLIVLDVGLPDGNGFDFCRELRQTNQVPVLFLTARSSEVDRVVGLELGADDYVQKPFSPREVTARVRAILRRSVRTQVVSQPTGTSALPKVMPLVIDSERKSAKYFGKTLALTTQEFRILAALAEKPGRVLSRAALLDLAWDDPGSVFDRIVDSHVKGLRGRLREIRPDCDPIRTVRGEGYALTEEWPL